MKLLTNPLVLLALALFLGVGVGLGAFWSAALPLVQAARATVVTKDKPIPPEKPWDFWTLEIDNLAAELKEQKKVLAEREQILVAREGRLSADQAELIKTRQQIESLRAGIAEKMVEVQADEAKNLKTLSNTYSQLSPKAAVGILSEMEETTVIKILSLMKTDVLAPILEQMGKSTDPIVIQKAARYSEKLRLIKSTPKPPSAS